MKKRINLPVVIVLCLLSIASAFGGLIVAFSSNMGALYKVETIADLIAVSIASFYLINGYKKDFNFYYKAAMLTNALNALVVCGVSVNENTKIVSVISTALCFGLILLLALGTNLGIKMSMISCLIVVFLRISGIIAVFSGANYTFTPEVILLFTQLVLAIIITVSTYAKYVDKSLRHTS